MIAYLLSRLWQSLILLVLVSIIGFCVLNLAPGGPLSQYTLMPGMTKEALDRIAEQMGLNRPLYMQYLSWAGRLLQGDWVNPIAMAAKCCRLLVERCLQRYC